MRHLSHGTAYISSCLTLLCLPMRFLWKSMKFCWMMWHIFTNRWSKTCLFSTFFLAFFYEIHKYLIILLFMAINWRWPQSNRFLQLACRLCTFVAGRELQLQSVKLKQKQSLVMTPQLASHQLLQLSNWINPAPQKQDENPFLELHEPKIRIHRK